MTNNQHGQVPEALIDLIDAYAETRHRYGRIYNARTEAARNAVIEALSEVQALSAAPEAIAKLRHLYQNMVNGAVRDTASAKRIAEGLLAPAIEALERATPPAEQQAQAGAVPQGWKAVPVNPTPEMWKAAKSVPDPNPPYPPHYGLVWDAMLAASPTPPAEQAAPKAAPGGAIDEAMRERADALNDVQERMTSLHKPAVDKAWGQFQSAMAAPQPAPATQQAGEVRRAELVPGVMHCAKCKFQLNRVTLCVSDGNAYAGNNKTEPCPNGCGPLWPVTWEQEAKNCWKALEEMHERLMAAAAPQHEVQEPWGYARKMPGCGWGFCSKRQYEEAVADGDETKKLYATPQPTPAELEQLRERISRMGLDVDRAMRGHVNEQSPLGTQRLAAIAALAKPAPAPLSDDAKDAARYRWLRNKSTVLHGTAWLGSATAYQRDVDFLRRDDALAALDAAIDAAIAAQGGSDAK